MGLTLELREDKDIGAGIKRSIVLLPIILSLPRPLAWGSMG